MAEAPAKEFSAEVKELGDKVAALTVKSAQELVDYLKDAYNIEPAGGGVMMAPGVGAAEEVEEQTQFDVELVSFGDKKIQVIKVIRSLTTLGLKEAKDLVESCPKIFKEDVTKEEADKIKGQIEEVGGAVTIK